MTASTQTLESAIYTGQVFHQRFTPTQNKFAYQIFLYWLKLSELPRITSEVSGFSEQNDAWSWVKFRRSDYLGEAGEPLEEAVLRRMNELANTSQGSVTEKLTGDVFMLGQVRTLGLYFSPVNFYYLRNQDGDFTHMLAEVSNTPWNERHHYLVDLKKQDDTEKRFFVSPFNPMDMTYKWRVDTPDEHLKLNLSCFKGCKHFEAALDMRKTPLTSRYLRNSLLSIPSMTIKTVFGIYWQATKLFFKRTPIYSHN